MSERDDLSANYALLSRRISAIEKDIGLEMDGEKRVTLEQRRSDLVKQRDTVGAQLSLASWRTSDGEATDAQQMMDARLSMTENTLRGLDAKMDKLIDQVHDIDVRQRLLEQQVIDLRHQIDDVRNEVVLVRTFPAPDLPRTWLLAGGLSVLLALIMLVLITWRVM